MNNIKPISGASTTLGTAPRFVGGLAMALWLAMPAAAALPPAGSVIGNQASASYTDASGQSKSATSNLVETTVQQVGAFTLTDPNVKTAAVGNTVYMPHTLTNTGNGIDSFKLTLTDNTGTFNATNLAIYLDANADGLPDSTTALCSGVAVCTNYVTPSLPSGGRYNFVVSMTVPAGAADGNSDNVTVTATAGTASLYTTTTATNTDTLNVTGAAAFQVNKSISATQGGTGGTLTYTLTYKNVGAAAGNLMLQDVIGAAGSSTAGYAYKPTFARWSAGNTSLNDNAMVDGTPDQANIGGMDAYYEAITSGSTTTIKANINNVGPNVTGTVTFDVTVLPTALPGISTTTNTASFAVDPNSIPTDNGSLTLQPTNPSSYNVLSSYSVVFNDGTAAAADGSNTRPLSGDVDASNNDLVRIAAASPGQTITFSNTVWNTGNSTDTFNITAAGMAAQAPGSVWPAGTTFQLFKSDGSSPLLDSNGDGVADTGAMTANSSYTVILKVTLPTGACPVVGGVITCPPGPFDVVAKATSVGNPDVSNVTYDRLAALTAPTVDLANSTGTVDTAVNQDVIGGTPTTNNPNVLPGQTTTFDLFVRNEGLIADTYDLAYSGTNAFAPATALPAGWTVQFRNGACTGTGSVITSVAVNPSAEKQICAIVSVPAGALAGTTNVYFQVLSQVTGAFDAKWDAVTVKSLNSLTLAPSGTGQVFPGGTIVYPHTLTNTGNTSCGTDFTFTISDSLAAQGWTFVLYKDLNNDGVIDSGDTVISPQTVSTTLAPAEQFKILVKVFSPAGAAAATTDVTSLYVSSTCDTTATATTSNTATDTTTVVTGQIRLLKSQKADSCTAAMATTGFSPNPLTAKPGDCITYQVIATNEGLGPVTALTISDSLPSYTTGMSPLAFPDTTVAPVCMTVPVGTGSSTATGTAGYAASLFTCSGLALEPSNAVTLTFRVKVNQ
ncbi:MAG: hypothetical protein M3R45_10975 [Pseudomonadota bacterium]|nr:hypothetical protein [Pseudomonadota bacterium]